MLTREFRVGVKPPDTCNFLRNVLAPLWQVYSSPALYQAAFNNVQDRYAFSFYDSLIIAAARKPIASACSPKTCNAASASMA